MSLALSKPTLPESASPPFAAGRKISAVEMALVWKVLHEDPSCPSRVVLAKVAQRQVPLEGSVRSLNRLRAKWNLKRSKGRPRHRTLSPAVASGGAVVEVTPHLSSVGVPLLAHGLDHHEGLAPVVARLKQAIAA